MWHCYNKPTFSICIPFDKRDENSKYKNIISLKEMTQNNAKRKKRALWIIITALDKLKNLSFLS